MKLPGKIGKLGPKAQKSILAVTVVLVLVMVGLMLAAAITRRKRQPAGGVTGAPIMPTSAAPAVTMNPGTTILTPSFNAIISTPGQQSRAVTLPPQSLTLPPGSLMVPPEPTGIIGWE